MSGERFKDSVETEQEAFVASEQMAEWLSEYVTGVVESTRASNTVPLLTADRLSTLFGEVSIDEGLMHFRAIYQVIGDAHRFNCLMFVAGYSAKALQIFADSNFHESVAELQKRASVFAHTPVATLFDVNQSTSPVPNDRVEDTGAQQSDGSFSDLSWQEDALCGQTDLEAFFPEKGGSTREAKKVCALCDVREQCLNYALANNERFGIWGGFSERERHKLKKRGLTAIQAITEDVENKQLNSRQARGACLEASA